jgi:hypothetical protein
MEEFLHCFLHGSTCGKPNSFGADYELSSHRLHMDKVLKHRRSTLWLNQLAQPFRILVYMPRFHNHVMHDYKQSSPLTYYQRSMFWQGAK